MKFLPVVSLTLLLTNLAMAQQPEPRRTFAIPGVVEIGGSASFSSYVPVTNGGTGDAVYTAGLSAAAGYFVADGLEVLVDPLVVMYSWSGDVKAFEMIPMAGLAYNFRAHPRAFPYVEGLAGFAFSWSDNGVTADVKRSGFAWSARAGLKALLTSTAIVNIGVQYQQVTLNVSSASERNGYDQFGLTAGLAVWL